MSVDLGVKEVCLPDPALSNKRLLLTRVTRKAGGPLAFSSRPLLAGRPRSRIARRYTENPNDIEHHDCEHHDYPRAHEPSHPGQTNGRRKSP
jgi:hypothetical protein